MAQDRGFGREKRRESLVDEPRRGARVRAQLLTQAWLGQQAVKTDRWE
jgi:hypothetical protein